MALARHLFCTYVALSRFLRSLRVDAVQKIRWSMICHIIYVDQRTQETWSYSAWGISLGRQVETCDDRFTANNSDRAAGAPRRATTLLAGPRRATRDRSHRRAALPRRSGCLGRFPGGRVV